MAKFIHLNKTGNTWKHSLRIGRRLWFYWNRTAKGVELEKAPMMVQYIRRDWVRSYTKSIENKHKNIMLYIAMAIVCIIGLILNT